MKFWVWQEGDLLVAYNAEYPCYKNGDPLTLGEPLGTFEVSDQKVPRRAKPLTSEDLPP
jgi:hypothetical protein